MPDNPRILQLLDELCDSQTTPEEVCKDCPELLPRIRERWRQMCRVQAELDALFPVAPEPTGPPAPLQEVTTLPRIPGYEVEAVLGRGGMGVVFRARHLRLNRVVALKMALADAYAGPQERERFQREAEAVAGLRHPNVVQIYDVGDSDGRPYFTMEYVEGGSMAQKLAGAPQPAREAAALLATLAGAVQAAHHSGILHRDLKPANVLLSFSGRSQSGVGSTPPSRSDTLSAEQPPNEWVPKITDFGLARRLDGAAGLTCTGTALGTPSYMAPEQAQGKTDALRPATDVYALGAMLYELLTGRPPFHGATAAETVLQVIHQDPVPPSRLNGKVPRDLETICLKCLYKEPRLRYASAAALAEDLDCFLRGEAIAARPEGRLERLARRVRRRPALSAALAAGTLAALALLGGGLWLSSEQTAAERRRKTEQAAVERAADEDLREMTRWQETSSWPEASAALERAKGRLGDRGSADLRRRLNQGVRDLDLAARLDAIRLGRATRLGEPSAFARSDEDYAVAFREAGFGSDQDAQEVVAARIQASNVRNVLVAALDDWAACTRNPGRQDWLLAVARQADQDPTGWRTRARSPDIRKDDVALVRLVATAPVTGQSVPFLLALAERLKSVGADPIPFLTRVQQAHPADFWANLSLAEALMEKNDLAEAIRFYQAAVALRPGAAVVYDNLGLALALLGRMDQADEQFRKASSIDPTAAPAHNHLGIVFSTMGRRDEAIDRSRLPSHFSGRVAPLHLILGDYLRDKGKLVEAMDRYRQAIALDPKLTPAQQGLRTLLLRQGRLEEVRLAWGKAIDAAPPEYDAWDGYAELCLFLGQEAEYRRVRRLLLDRFGASTDPMIAERTGRACLLLPAPEAELQSAAALIDRVLAAVKRPRPDSFGPYYRFAKGLAEYRRGHLGAAICEMDTEASKVMGPAPRLVQAMAQHRQGRKAQARKTLAAAVLSYDWRPSVTNYRDDWIIHVLRREAEAVILPNLRAFLEGTYQPADNDERLALVEGCWYTNRPRTAARLYTEAFAADQFLAEDLRCGHRYNAARAAALAGCGRGEDAANLSQQERTRWRNQARAWLELDLAAWGRQLDNRAAADRDLVRQTLKGWLAEADLGELRDLAALEKLSVKERNEWLALWKAVNALLDRTPRS
jgi:serine/threonine-protein kinase